MSKIESIPPCLRRCLESSVANLEREDVPCAPVLSPDQAIAHPQVKASGTVEEVTHPVMGRMLRPRPAARFSKSPAEISRHAPALGEHGGEVLGELGLGEQRQIVVDWQA